MKGRLQITENNEINAFINYSIIGELEKLK